MHKGYLLALAAVACATVAAELAASQPLLLVAVDRAYVQPLESFNVTVYAYGQAKGSTVEVRLLRGDETYYETSLPISDVERLTLRAPPREGLYSIEVSAKLSTSSVVARVAEPLPVINESAWTTPLLLSFVWHCHQGINLMPDGSFHGIWAFTYVYENVFAPYYEGGPYTLLATMLERHPDVKFTVNLSPSLLWQWMYAIAFGYRDASKYTYVPPNSSEANAVKTLLSRIKCLIEEGKLELLTSFFNHPIPGYIVEKFEWGGEVMQEELSWGILVARRAFNVTPRGVWIPEMFFSMKLVKPLEKAGIAYTVLDARYHLSGASGEVGSPYETYILKDTEGNSLEVLFRDSELSDLLSFGINPSSEKEAEVLARRFVALILARKLEHREAKFVVIAADGENWLLGNKLKAVFFDRMLGYVERSSRVLRSVTVSEILSMLPPRRELSHVPTTSWAGGDWVWTSRSENHQQWDMIAKAGECYVKVRQRCSDPAIVSAAAFSLFLTLNSDVIHREYTMLAHTYAWYRQTESICREGKEEAEKLLSKHFTPDLSSPSVQVDCRACEPSLLEFVPHAILAVLLVAGIVAFRRLRRRR